MDLLGRLHPGEAGVSDKNERYTPLSLIRPLHARHHFTVDAAGCAAAPASTLIGRWWDKAADGMAQSWDGERVWCNPPYDNIPAWVEKAWASLALVVMLIPCNRTEQPWWQEMIEPHRDRTSSIIRTHFLPKRIRFLEPRDDGTVEEMGSPEFGCVLIIWKDAARQRSIAGLGGRR